MSLKGFVLKLRWFLILGAHIPRFPLFLSIRRRGAILDSTYFPNIKPPFHDLTLHDFYSQEYFCICIYKKLFYAEKIHLVWFFSLKVIKKIIKWGEKALLLVHLLVLLWLVYFKQFWSPIGWILDLIRLTFSPLKTDID